MIRRFPLILGVAALSSLLALAGRAHANPQDDAEAKAIDQFFDTFGEAIRKTDRDKVAASFDVERMLQDIRGLGIFAGLKRDQEQKLFEAVRQGLSEGFTRYASLIRWDRHQVKQIKYLADKSEAVVYVRHRDDDGTSIRMRWWLKKRDGRWRIYDYEDLNTGLRGSLLLGILQLGGGRADLAWVPSFERVMAAAQAMQQMDIARAEKELRAVADVKFPPLVDALRWMFTGLVALAQLEPEDALKHFDKAESLHADCPILHYLRAIACNQMGEHAKALAHGRKYIQVLGDDAQGYVEIGNALLELKRPEEAADAFRKGLDDDPDSDENFEGLRQALPAGKKAELGERFARLTKPEEEFEDRVEDALLDDDAEAAEVLVAAYRKKAPKDPAADYYAARAKVLKDDTPEAVRLFKVAIARVKDADKRQDYIDGFLEAMLDAGKPLEAYQAAPEPDNAFAFLCGSLAVSKDEKALRRLIEAHRKQRPNDLEIHFFTGQAELLAEDYDKAEQAFAAAAARAQDDDDKERFRYWRVRARYQAGKGLSAYGQIGPRKATFDQLAEEFASEEDAKQLEALVAAHRKADPNDKDLPFWEAEAKWLGKDYEKVVCLLTEHRRTILANKERRDTFQDRLIRSLVRLKRPDEAVKEARAITPDEGDLLLMALAHAAAGDVTRTAETLEKCLKEGGYSLQAIYGDPDLGALLRGDHFRELRQKYPEPRDSDTPPKEP